MSGILFFIFASCHPLKLECGQIHANQIFTIYKSRLLTFTYHIAVFNVLQDRYRCTWYWLTASINSHIKVPPIEIPHTVWRTRGSRLKLMKTQFTRHYRRELKSKCASFILYGIYNLSRLYSSLSNVLRIFVCNLLLNYEFWVPQ